MTNRLFDHFPQEKTKCPICGTNDDKPCFLVPIDGTERQLIYEAQPTHASCITDHLDKFRMNKDVGVIYIPIEKSTPK